MINYLWLILDPFLFYDRRCILSMNMNRIYDDHSPVVYRSAGRVGAVPCQSKYLHISPARISAEQALCQICLTVMSSYLSGQLWNKDIVLFLLHTVELLYNEIVFAAKKISQ